ncbi:MAG: diguanylate cyclase, partial [Deltaproteobacteria bacterium]|nr:diguanylate cyclase [Deltaproteobacteria bacterium]
KKKYAHRQIDIVMVSDSNAFNFVRKFKNLLFKDTPVVFCGVNYLENLEAINQENTTGVMESLDIAGTIRTILAIHPETEKILVINDSTTTGQQMQKDVEKNILKIQDPPKFEYLSQLPMKDMLERLKNQDEKTVVLMLSFFRDGKNTRYPIKTSVSMITEACNRPVYGFIESFLDFGILGGSFALGRDQGRLAAGLATRILDGETAGDIPILQKHPYHFIFDNNVLKRFNIPGTALPAKSAIINEPTGFYYKYKRLVDIAVIVFMALVFLVIVQQLRLRREERKKTEFETAARTDGLTRTIPRNFFVPEVEAQIANCRAENKKLTLSYCDIDNLKSVNDTFGHREGDNYIVTMVEVIQSTIRACDRIYRMGGDEFMIVFADCNTSQAKNRIRNIREKLACLNNRPGNSYEKGMSFGFAEFDPANPKTLEQLLEEADELMYREKNGNGFLEKS